MESKTGQYNKKGEPILKDEGEGRAKTFKEQVEEYYKLKPSD